MQGNANKTLKMGEKVTPIFWRCQSMLPRLWRCRNMPSRILTLHEHAHRREMMQHQLRIYNQSSFWRKSTSSRFRRHDVKQHHWEGRWCGSNFRAMKWHNLEKRRCSLDLQGTKRCPQEITDAKHTSKMWENVHRRWVMPWRLHFLQKKLEILFYSITKHQLMFIIILRKVKQRQLLSLHFRLWRPLIIISRSWLSLSNVLPTKGILKAIDDLRKILQAKLAIFLLFMWLNLVTSIKLPTYPREKIKSSRSSTDFFFSWFFLMIFFFVLFCFVFLCFFVCFFFFYFLFFFVFLFFVFCFCFWQKGGLTCVILALCPMTFHGYQLRNSGYHH